MKSIFTIVGARPQFIKAAVVSREIRQRNASLRETIIHTGQHFDAGMSDVFFDELDIPRPDHALGIGGGTHGENTGRMLEQVERVLMVDRPDFVLVYGDTDTTLAGALAAAKIGIPVAHVEAGLRSFNRSMPEELNRVLTDHISAVLFAPTEVATRNLAREGITGASVVDVGDVMFDAARYYADLADKRSDIVDRLGLTSAPFILATLHRAGNVDDRERLAGIFAGFEGSTIPIVMPLHPRTRKRIEEFGVRFPDVVRLVEPVGYLDMVTLERHSELIVTDSGGVQKEAYFHRVPCVTLRDETEWVELVEIGANRLVGSDPERISDAIESFRPDISDRELYGDGNAGRRIVDWLES